jgi:hypothetical protein
MPKEDKLSAKLPAWAPLAAAGESCSTGRGNTAADSPLEQRLAFADETKS